MTKRIVSGIFILTALGALGVILAGALTSGEQLIVRFLTAVIVAALGLYVISDLRLQADDDAAVGRPGSRPRLAGIDVPPNSTAAFMATVTGKGDAPVETVIQDDLAGDDPIEPHEQGVGAASSSTSEPTASAVVEDAGSPDGPPVPSILGPAPVTVRAAELPELGSAGAATITDLFAHRTAETSAEATSSWPAVGGGIGFERDRSVETGPADEALRDEALADETLADEARPEETMADQTMVDDTMADEFDDADTDQDATDQGTVEQGNVEQGNAIGQEAVVASDAEADQDEREPVDPVAVTEFEYSGDLEAPEFEWPAAPSEPPAAPEVPEAPAEPEPMTATATATPTTVTPAETADGRQAEVPIESTDVPAFDRPVSAQPVTAEADGDLLTAAVDGVERPLPSPFLDRTETSAADYADAPLAPIIDLRDVTPHSGPGVEAAIRSGELEVISALIEQGMLSTDGPISDRDVRTMVYVAFTSNELRKLLLAGGVPDGPNPGIDLGPVELFGNGLAQPPKTLYTGAPALPAEARSQLG